MTEKQCTNRKLETGDMVEITGKHDETGKIGYISQAAPSGLFFGVTDYSEKFLGYFHESDLRLFEDHEDQEDCSHDYKFTAGTFTCQVCGKEITAEEYVNDPAIPF